MTDTSVEVRINRLVAEADVAFVVGPVFPHEVVGFSGGNKYFFPGVAGPELINLSHWLGALITSAEMIGTRGVTPVRALSTGRDADAGRTAGARLVVASGTDNLHAPRSARRRRPGRPRGVLGADPRALPRPPGPTGAVDHAHQYEEIWTAAKGMYKLEPIVADGGEVIIYAPHITVGHAPADRRDRLPHPRLLPQAVGAVQGPAVGHPGPLHARPRARHLRPEHGERSRVTVTLPPASTRTRAGGQSATSTRPESRPGRGVGTRPGHSGRTERRRGALSAGILTNRQSGRRIRWTRARPRGTRGMTEPDQDRRGRHGRGRVGQDDRCTARSRLGLEADRGG